MPETSYQYPFGTPRWLETSGPVGREQLSSLLVAATEGVTIEITRPNVGAGYFFHIKESDKGYDLLSYTGEVLITLEDIDVLTRFVNHVSGLRFDAECWQLSNVLNRKIEAEEANDTSRDEE
jgi:hypothetical protein